MVFLKKSRAARKVKHDDDGVIAEPKPKRARPVLSPEEEAARVALVAKREARKDAQLRALESLSPSGARPGDPPLRVDSLLDVSHSTVVPLLTLPRLSGQGLDGSALTVVERHHDGDNGGPAQGAYAVAYCEFRDAQGYRARTRGVAVRRSEMRPLAECLLALADRLDSSEKEADSLPETLPERLA
jgi:hypothetical protein